MEPTIWGPKMWFTMHTLTLNYPSNPTDTDKKIYANFFNSLKLIIPCEQCRKHYIEHLEKKPVEYFLDNKDKLVKWLIDIHNEVNRLLNKKIYSYDEALQIYKDIYVNKSTPLKKCIKYSLLIFVILCVIVFFYKCFKKKNIF